MIRRILLICMVMILCVQTTSYALEDITLEVNNTKVKSGDSISASGIAEPNEFVSLKIIDELGNILYFNAVRADEEGKYQDTFYIPDTNPGTLTLIAGNGDNVESVEIEVYRPKKKKKSNNTTTNTTTQKDKDGSVTITTPKPKVNEDQKTAETSIDSKELENAFEQAEENQQGKKKIELEIPKTEDVLGYKIELPKKTLKSNKKQEIEIKTDIGTATLPGNMIDNTKTGSTGNITFSMKIADKSKLTDKQKKKIGDKPVIELQLMEDGQRIKWKNRKAPVTIAIPYTPTAKELKNKERITVWYIDGAGKVKKVRSGRYNEETGMVEFTVKHFSTYAVVYDDTTFDDLESYPWAKYEIEVLAVKGIANGTGNNNFTPSANISRADFLTLLIRTLELEADVTNNFDDIKDTDYYYESVGIAKALGITTGNGQNKFNPKESITRQDMIVLTKRALKTANKLTEIAETSQLESFNDKTQIANYAKESIAVLVKEGLIKGSNNMINPKGNTTRAEAAVLLYRIYHRD